MNERLKILCVEDSEEDFILIERELRRLAEPFEIRHVMKSDEFQLALKSFGPDVVLCDHNLPGFSSQEAFELLKILRPGVPFILVTATVSEDEGARQIIDGIDDYILKDRLRRLPSAITRAVRFARSEMERSRYFEELVRHERQFRALVENSSETIVLCDQELQISYTSPSFPRLFPDRTSEIAGKSILTLVAPAHQQSFYGQILKTRKNPGSSRTTTFSVDGPGLDVTWMECTMKDLTEDPVVKAIVFNLRDVTVKVESHEAAERTQAILSAIIDNSRIGYVLVDTTFRIAAYNNEATRRYKLEFGKELQDGAFIFDYLPEERRAEERQRYQTALKGETFKYEISFAQGAGMVNWYEVRVFPVEMSGHGLTGFIISSEDISERKTSEHEKDALTAELLSQNKNLEQFSLIISHNLRAPVATIQGLSRLLEMRDQLSDAEARRCTEGMSAAAHNIDQVISDLSLILQQKRALTEHREDINLDHLLSGILSLLEDTIHDSKATIHKDLKAASYFGIRSYMHSIFLNLISNSIRYRRPGMDPILTVSSAIEENKLLLSFSDNGLGIDLALHGHKIFGLYKKFHLNSDGRGMGLYMVKTQAEIMGGTVEVESAPLKGTTFRLTFPL